jgi:hypothetical protein
VNPQALAQPLRKHHRPPDSASPRSPQPEADRVRRRLMMRRIPDLNADTHWSTLAKAPPATPSLITR